MEIRRIGQDIAAADHQSRRAEGLAATIASVDDAGRQPQFRCSRFDVRAERLG